MSRIDHGRSRQSRMLGGMYGKIARDANRRRREQAVATLEERMRECGCRWLTGREFERRAAELMREDRARRKRAT